jgi:hypothetical protein
MSVIERLRIAALPFVTRSLRGGRSRRLWVLAFVLAIATSLVGGWLALGSGELERGIREDLRLEQRRYEREMREFVVIVPDDDLAWRRATGDLREAEEGGLVRRYDSVVSERTWIARSVLNEAVATAQHVRFHDAELRELAVRARALLDEFHQPVVEPTGRARLFDWNDSDKVELLHNIVERRGIPSIERYASPLGLADAVRIVGFFACGMLLVLVVVVGPVLTGIAIAQEAHENTLQPVAGTALSARQIAGGLVLGALAPVAIVAAPQAAIAVLAGIVAGHALTLAAFVALLVACAWAITMLALAVGLFAGRRRGSGAIAITLLAGLGVWLCAGIPLGFEPIGRTSAAIVTLLPSGGLVWCMRETFLGPLAFARFEQVPLDGPLVAAACASLVVGALALRAAERRVVGRFVAPLHRGEVLLGSAVLSALTVFAMWQKDLDGALFASLAVMVMPMQVLLMSRVPVGDAPAGFGTVRLGALMREFAAFVGIHFAFALVLHGPDVLDKIVALPAIHVVWALAIAPLVAIRIVVGVPRLVASVWAGFAFVLAIVEYFSGVGQLISSRQEELFPIWRVSPLLGILHVALLVLVPWTLVRGIRRAGGRATC